MLYLSTYLSTYIRIVWSVMHKNWQNAAKVVTLTSLGPVLICLLYPSDRKVSMMQKPFVRHHAQMATPILSVEKFRNFQF